MDASHDTDVLIIGGGPAGSLLACLLARRGVDVVLVEKQDDLERSFRGETVAARSVLTLGQLGFGAALKQHGYLEQTGISMWEEGRRIVHIDYTRLPIDALPIDIPQPGMIGIFLEEAAQHPNFTFLSGTAFSEILEQDGAVRGALLKTREGETVKVRSRLLVGADGRFSKVRKTSGLPVAVTPMPRDFLWFKFPRPRDWGSDGELMAHQDKHLIVLPTFPDLLRVGYNLPKRGFSKIRGQGLPSFRAGIAELDPRLAGLAEEHITSWKDTSFLEIFTAEMPRWSRDGLLLIGDAAHTSSPILGQGVNLALQDSVIACDPITAGLSRTGANQSVPAEVFHRFVAERYAHKARITRFQRIQEKSLAHTAPTKTALRRARMRAMDKLPFKHRLVHALLNAPHNMKLEGADVSTG